MAGYNRTERAMVHVGAPGAVVVANPARKGAAEVLYVLKMLDPTYLAAEQPQR